MKYLIALEEINVKNFELEVNSLEETYEIAERKYKSGDFVLEPGECQFRQMKVIDATDGNGEWREF